MWFWQECTTARTNESRYPLAISIVEFPNDVRLILHKSRFDVCLECQVTVLSKLDFKNVYEKVSIFRKKVFTSWIWTHNLLNASQLLYPLSYMAVVLMECCSSFFHFIVFNPPQNASWPPHQLAMANLKEEDDRFMILSSWYGNVGSPRRVNSVTDRQMNRISAFYI